MLKKLLPFLRKYYLYPLENVSFTRLMLCMFLLYMPLAIASAWYLYWANWPFAVPISSSAIAANLFLITVPAGMDVIYWSVPHMLSTWTRVNTPRVSATPLVFALVKTTWLIAAGYSVVFMDLNLRLSRQAEFMRALQCSQAQRCRQECMTLPTKNWLDVVHCTDLCESPKDYCNGDSKQTSLQ